MLLQYFVFTKDAAFHIFNLKAPYISQLALSVSFEYLCYGSTAIRNILSYSAGTVFIRKNLTSVDVRF